MDTGEETPPEGDGGFDDTDDAMSEDDQDDDSEGDPDAAAAAAALERDDALPVHVRRGPPADDEEADDDDADDDADDEEEEEEEHGDEEHGDDETGVPPELEAAAAAADAPRAAHAAALAAIRRAHAVRATPLLAEWLLRAWRRQMVSMALTTDEWLAFSRDAQAVAMPWDDLFEDLAVAVGQRPVSPQLWLELARAAFGFGGDESVEKMRRVLSDAVDVAGLDLSQGQRLWEASIAFEADVGDEAKQLALWLKRLATPLTWSESALLGFKTKYTAADRKRGEAAHAAALKLRKLREPHEGAVSRAADDEARCDAWLAYTAFEQPARRRAVLERGLAALDDRDEPAPRATRERLWLAYIAHAAVDAKDAPLALQVARRGVLSVPESLELRLALLKCCERLGSVSEDDWAEGYKAFKTDVKSLSSLALAQLECDRRRGSAIDAAPVLERLGEFGADAFAMHEIAKYVATDLYVRAARHPASRPILFDAARKAWKAILDGSKDLALSLRLKYYRAAIAAARTADDCDEARRLYRAAAGAAVHQATSQRGDAADASLAKATSEAWVSFEKERGTLATLDAAEARQRNWRRDLDGHFKVHGGARKTLKQPEVATKAKAPPSAATLATRKRAADAAAAASAKKRSRGADGEPVAAQAPETAEAVPEAPAAVAEAPAAAPLDAPPAAADGEARAPGAKKKKQKSAASNEASDELARTAFVTNTGQLEDAALAAHFSRCGQVSRARVLKDKRSGDFKHTAFVVFVNAAGLDAALNLDVKARSVAGGAAVEVSKSRFLAPALSFELKLKRKAEHAPTADAEKTGDTAPGDAAPGNAAKAAEQPAKAAKPAAKPSVPAKAFMPRVMRKPAAPRKPHRITVAPATDGGAAAPAAEAPAASEGGISNEGFRAFFADKPPDA